MSSYRIEMNKYLKARMRLSTLFTIISLSVVIHLSQQGNSTQDFPTEEDYQVDDDKFERELEKILDGSADLTMIEIKQKVDHLLAQASADKRRTHQEWKEAQGKRDAERAVKIKAALFSLSKAAQSKLLRLILIQEDDRITQDVKRSKLQNIARNIRPEIRMELLRHLHASDLFSGFDSLVAQAADSQ